MSVSCDPNDLLELARCYRCLPEHRLRQIRTYLLCQFAIGGSGPPSIPVISDVVYGADPDENNCNLVIQITASVATICSDGGVYVLYGSDDPGGAGPIEISTFPITSHSQTVAITAPLGFDYFFLTQRCTDLSETAISNIIADVNPDRPTAAPVLSNLVYGTNGAGETNFLLSFDINTDHLCPDGGNWVLYGSDDGLGTGEVVLATQAITTVPVTFNLPAPLAVNKPYLYVSQLCTGGCESVRSSVITLADPAVVEAAIDDWDTRVQGAGGAALGNDTRDAGTALIQELIINGLYDKVKALNIFAPDSLIAACTPIIANLGAASWINSNFIAGDLNKYGLKGNATNKSLDTEIDTIESTQNSNAVCVMTDDTDLAEGGTDLGAGQGATSFAVTLAKATDGSSGPYALGAIPDNGLNGRMSIDTLVRSGFILASRSAANSAKLYFANRWNQFALIKSNTNVMPDLTNTVHWLVFASNNLGTPYDFSARRIRVVGFFDPLSQSEGEALYNALKTVREAFEDGAQTHGENWATRVVRNGGAAPAQSSIDAIDDFLDALNTAGILYKMYAVSAVPPDSIKAVAVPIWRSNCKDIWQTTFFSGLTVNGLIGDDTNWMETGHFPFYGYSTSGPFPGMTAYHSAGTGAAGNGFLGCNFASGRECYLLPEQTGLGVFDAWNNTTDRALWTQAGFLGFISGNRTANNKSVVYLANSGQAFAAKVTQNNATTGACPTFNEESLAWSSNSPSPPPMISSQRYSFAAIHLGLDATECEALYNAVQAMRVAFGGGYI